MVFARLFVLQLFLVRAVSVSGLLAPKPQTAAVVADLQRELDAQGLGLCHGILHASGVRTGEDLKSLTSAQIESMGADFFDRTILYSLATTTTTTTNKKDGLHNNKFSTSVNGAFARRPRGRFEAEVPQNFDFRVVEKDIFRGQLFTVEQCEQLSRMAEYHAYRGIGTIGAGWTNELYTLTAKHLQCKEIPGWISTTKPIFDQLLRSVGDLYPGRLKQGSIVYESDGEPHLVKYEGKAKGTALHTDNSEFVYITVNILLSAPTDFTGGGTYITKLDQTIHLEQGGMLIHLGDLEHAGVEITSGVRRLCIAFLACEWEDETLNIEKHRSS